MATTPSSAMRSLDRAFDVLGVLEDTRQPLRLSEVARRAELHVATAQRILNVLIERGYAAKEETGYVAGPAAVATAHAFLVNNRLSQVALPVLQELAATTSLTASLYVRVGHFRVLIARVQGRNPLRYQLPIGEKLPLYLGAGKALAAWLPDAELHSLIEQSAPFTRVSGEHVTAEDLAADLDQVRKAGYALSLSERAVNVTAVSAPIRHAEDVLGALSIAGPSSELTETDHTRLIGEVCRAADAIAARCP
ncbi:IclR family transcriptional regulator [Streptomyces sp. NPDC044780]|uniref:IclR family transcriptional regulator n=1 Tax=Streptomyces luomodiensis TaxID=3026192 RepID=A0ABY9UP53_9ACTN|nr:IclR family transcriptional regulator [Streptomyces sp. SCA4-21]WNE94246.1 IclR family transcriptional regulator [Streptomyces sp. SCA4-21]